MIFLFEIGKKDVFGVGSLVLVSNILEQKLNKLFNRMKVAVFLEVCLDRFCSSCCGTKRIGNGERFQIVVFAVVNRYVGPPRILLQSLNLDELFCSENNGYPLLDRDVQIDEQQCLLLFWTVKIMSCMNNGLEKINFCSGKDVSARLVRDDKDHVEIALI